MRRLPLLFIMRCPVLESIAHLPVQQNTIDGNKTQWVIIMVLQEISFDRLNANFDNSLDNVLTNVRNKLEKKKKGFWQIDLQE